MRQWVRAVARLGGRGRIDIARAKGARCAVASDADLRREVLEATVAAERLGAPRELTTEMEAALTELALVPDEGTNPAAHRRALTALRRWQEWLVERQ